MSSSGQEGTFKEDPTIVPPNNEAKIETVSLSDKRKQQVADTFDNICITAGRKNEHTFTLYNDKDGTKYKKTFFYHAASSGERYKISKIEERRALAIRSVVEFATLRKKAKGKDADDIELFSTVDHELNYTMANIFLKDRKEDESGIGKGMTQQEFEAIPFTEINPVLQGYALRTERPLPPPFETNVTDVIT